MLQLKHISKSYTTDSFTQRALDDVSLTLRDNEFVAILGPSGSGKTTLLNILGGLDHADSGEIVINGVSTKDYGPKDWDSYRNHRVGFVFQSYNLIPHQSVLSNVELALTLAGTSHGQRRERALAALEQVGLSEHAHKRPSQLSGGQMQRVAIARALVNDPDIVLADEPTGALDTETGVQVMDILKGVARDRLVVMVTHNPELAERYATRIVRFRDGHVQGDSDPMREGEHAISAGAPAATSAAPRASMSFLTALSLSFNNLMTKKGRTLLTAFAGSIGIIGIAAILALSNGVNGYIADTEKSALSSYPLTITKSSFNISNMLTAGMAAGTSGSAPADPAGRQSGDSIPQNKIMTDMFAQVKSNDLSSFKAFLDGGQSGMEPYVNAIQYSYGITPQIYKADTSGGIVRLNPSRMVTTLSNGVMGSAFTGGASRTSFSELIDDRPLLESQASLVAGSWPAAADEAVLVLDSDGQISDYTLYSLGFYDTSEMDGMMDEALAGKEVTVPESHRDFSYEDALNMSFKVVPAPALYQRNSETGGWTDMSENTDFMREALDAGVTLKVVGVIKPNGQSSSALVREGVAYTSSLTRELMEDAEGSQLVQEQLASPETDVFTGKGFDELKSEQGASLDMSSLFSVDEDALKSAFSLDTGALAAAPASLSPLDLSPLSPDLFSLDLSGLQLDTSALSGVLGPDSLAQMMAGAPRFSLEDAGLTDAASGLSDEQRSQLTQGANALASGFMAWAGSNGKLTPAEGESLDYAALLQEYLSTDAGRTALSAARAGLDGSVSDLVSDALQSYMTRQFAPYMAQQMQEKMRVAAQLMATQLAGQLQTQLAAATGRLGSQLSSAVASQIQGQMASLSSALSNGFGFDPSAFARAIKLNMSQEDLSSLLGNYMNAGDLSLDGNLTKLGYATADSPESISIYPKDFAAKEDVLKIIDGYNRDVEQAGRQDASIQYSDLVGTLMSSVTDIVNTISTVLIAFVSISLVVSSIMIGIITYISVLERRKEIGILRAMGASKLNVANIFNAETVIEGLISGVFAVLAVYLISLPVNAAVYSWQGVPNIMSLPVTSALALVAISVLLTFVAGLMPAMGAARRDPVEALRSE